MIDEQQFDLAPPLRVAVIGTGPIGTLHAQAISEAPGAQLAAVCDVNEQRLGWAARRFNVPAYQRVEDLLSDVRPDAVTIATPDHLHVEPALAAIEAGCHVFCEKPLATTVADAEQIVQAAATRRVQLGVDFNRRFMTGYRQAHKWLRTWWNGMPEQCLLRVTDRTPSRYVARHPYVMFSTLLSHHFDLVRWYGGEVRRIHAYAPNRVDGLVRQVSVSLELTSGATATIVGVYKDQQERTSEWLALHRAAGAIVVEEMTRRVIMSDNKPDGCFVLEFDPTGDDPLQASVVAHVRTFVSRLAMGQLLPVGGRDGLAGVKLAEAAIQSIESGSAIEVLI